MSIELSSNCSEERRELTDDTKESAMAMNASVLQVPLQ
jgi:hypothetical protein